MKAFTQAFWIVALHCAIAPLTCPAQNVTLITTLTNPAPASGENFGYSIAAVGNDRVLVGVPYDSAVALNAGVTYLFSSNGTRLTTFTNPAPAWDDRFGYSLAAVDGDRVVIGAPLDGTLKTGAAYLINASGALLTTFTNPTPAGYDQFGCSLAAVGSDRVLIGALGDGTGASSAGAAYLFSTNGTWLTTFTNPTPATFDHFGVQVTALGSDRVLIGVSGDSTGATSAGAAYLFSMTGTLLTTITNPTPVSFDYFGNSVAAVGNDRVLIGAYQENTGATDAGAAYLFSAPPAGTPSLLLVNPKCVGTNFTFSVQTQTGLSYTVEQNTNLATTNWLLYRTFTGDGSLMPCLVPITNALPRFFRVREP